MEPEGSLPHSQMPATCPYLEPTRFSPNPTSHFLKNHLNILPFMPASSKLPLSLRFRHQYPVYASSPHTRYMSSPSHKQLTFMYVFFWVFPRRQVKFCRRFGTLCQVHLQRLSLNIHFRNLTSTLSL
jgi:hypothetical protein